MEMGIAYNFRIRHVGAAGIASAYSSVVNHTVGGTPTTLSAVLNANATGVKTFLQNSVPTSVNAGDLWIDSNDGNKIYRATSSGNDQVTSGEWVLTTITAGAIGLGSVLNQAQVTTFAQDGVPTATAIGDLWMDTNDGNKVYRSQSVGADQVTSGEWVSTTLTKTGIGLGSVANERQITVFRQNDAPTATAVGDLWIDTNDNNRQYRASNRYIGSLFHGSTVRTAEQLIDAHERSVAGFDSSGNVNRPVPAAQITAAMADSLSAIPLASANWVTIDGSEFSPQGTTQDITVTYYNGGSNEVCVIRWTITKASGNSDYISACAEQTDSGNNFTLGSITNLSGNNKKFAECTVTHTASSATIVLKALISMTHVSGGGKS